MAHIIVPSKQYKLFFIYKIANRFITLRISGNKLSDKLFCQQDIRAKSMKLQMKWSFKMNCQAPWKRINLVLSRFADSSLYLRGLISFIFLQGYTLLQFRVDAKNHFYWTAMERCEKQIELEEMKISSPGLLTIHYGCCEM